MATDSATLAQEEYRALRATIRERGTLRLLVALITFVAWATLTLVVATAGGVAILGLVPLLVLAAGFEVVFASHVAVERVGRYIQATYELPGGAPPQWEHAAMAVGPRAAAGSGIDPTFSAAFILAALLNLVPIALLSATGTSLLGGVPLELGVFGLLHLLFVGRVLRARRYAATQRERDLALFKQAASKPGA